MLEQHRRLPHSNGGQNMAHTNEGVSLDPTNGSSASDLASSSAFDVRPGQYRTLDSFSSKPLTPSPRDCLNRDVAALIMKFEYQASCADKEASRAESILKRITQSTIPFIMPEEIESQRRTYEMLRKRAAILRELEEVYPQKACQLGSGSMLEDIRLVEEDNRVTKRMDHWYRSDPTIRASVDACSRQMEHQDRIFRIKGIFFFVHGKIQKVEEMRLRQLEMGLNGMALNEGDWEQDKVDIMADLLARLSL